MLPVGSHIGHYTITGRIGAGGMGEVYRATDSILGREVAIKVLPQLLMTDPDRVERLEREARTLAALNHPNIATIHGLENAAGARALVMELVNGETLADRLLSGSARPSGMPIEEAVRVARQIALALDTAHEHGIVHRDLKPSNIKIRDDGTVKVLDFGLAKFLEGPGAVPFGVSESPTITSPAGTQTGVILGTAAYMSPEQAPGQAADTRADIWAFGCVLYEMLTGARPFAADSVAETLAAVLMREPEELARRAETTCAEQLSTGAAHVRRLCLGLGLRSSLEPRASFFSWASRFVLLLGLALRSSLGPRASFFSWALGLRP